MRQETGSTGHIVLENSLSLPRPLANQLLSHAQKNPDNEVCGLIGRDENDLHNIDYYPVSNIADDTAHRFEMDPKQQIAAMKQMRDRNQALFAIERQMDRIALEIAAVRGQEVDAEEWREACNEIGIEPRPFTGAQ